ncbi:hypothetical protein J3R30DRAFT_2133187 [Lentinula aciculospora]|uniref:HIT-type domain-containing protein n=1 Tax=Lentinula aciculospora TaxID=153920 RepID=A0A9W9AGG0_9AGAR|nr:hypothetical protein J3R30DRAFT_2133187 [Lentinula aciculospora]
MLSGTSTRKSHKKAHIRTTSLLSQPCQTLIDFPKPASGAITELAHGSFTPTSSAFPCLTTLATLNMFHSDSTFSSAGYSRRRQRSMFEWPEMYYETDGFDTPSIPASPTSSFSSRAPSVPRITRTSSYDTHSSVSSSPSLLDSTLPPARLKPTDMNPILSELERKSKLCIEVAGCATCGKSGTDYPRCSKCGEMWCSRPCRLRGGKKHLCISRT